jgi:hypothetical protein
MFGQKNGHQKQLPEDLQAQLDRCQESIDRSNAVTRFLASLFRPAPPRRKRKRATQRQGDDGQ